MLREWQLRPLKVQKQKLPGHLEAAAWSQHSSAPLCNDARMTASLVTAQPVFSGRGLYKDLSATRHSLWLPGAINVIDCQIIE